MAFLSFLSQVGLLCVCFLFCFALRDLDEPAISHLSVFFLFFLSFLVFASVTAFRFSSSSLSNNPSRPRRAVTFPSPLLLLFVF